jgi:hypothetical protein
VSTVPPGTPPIITLEDGTEVYKIPEGVPEGKTIYVDKPEERVYVPVEVSLAIQYFLCLMKCSVAHVV